MFTFITLMFTSHAIPTEVIVENIVMLVWHLIFIVIDCVACTSIYYVPMAMYYLYIYEICYFFTYVL